MSNRAYAIQILAEKGEAVLTCNGNSMRPLMSPGQSIHLRKVDPSKLRVGDACFCKVKGSLTVHEIGAIDEPNQRFLIQNKAGFQNGWIGANNIYGLCVAVDNKVVVSQEELANR